MTCRIRQTVRRTGEQANKTRGITSAHLVPIEFKASFTLLYVILLCSWHTLIFFLVVFFLFSLALSYVLYVSHKLNFIMLSSLLSVTYTMCLHFHFLVSRPGVGGIWFPSISFCLLVVGLSVYRASNVQVDACNSSCLVQQLQSAVYLEQWLNNKEWNCFQWVLTVMMSPLVRFANNTVQL